ncbi:MAG: HAMP domain-containing histidine kinase [Myxococcales bacterium]|nr:HAMP domain-containing histidine kinase [Myxococcales bacterium]
MPASTRPAADPSPTADLGALHIHLLWLSKLRWGAILGQLATIFGVRLFMAIRLPLLPLLLIVGAEAVINAAVAVWLRRDRPVAEWMLFALMAVDVIALSGLLYLTGGPFNPFSFIYLVHIALAAAVLRARWTWALVGLSVLCFGALFWDHVWLDLDLHPSHLMDHMRMHLEGMFVAFGVAAAFIAYFVTRVRRALAAREVELAVTRHVAARAERLASLATLAAGAAHELSSPLGTIAVAARELEIDFGQRFPDEGAMRDDLSLIRHEVNRCRTILEQMAADAGEGIGAPFSRVKVRRLIDDAAMALGEGAVVAAGEAAVLDGVIEVPARALAQALRAVLKNAREASPPGAAVEVRATTSVDGVALRVRDRGAGMSAETLARLGEPFFTTKDAGQGMGLGVFLARAVLSRLGGRLDYASTAGGGTTATLHLAVRCDNLPLSTEGEGARESADGVDARAAAGPAR